MASNWTDQDSVKQIISLHQSTQWKLSEFEVIQGKESINVVNEVRSNLLSAAKMDEDIKGCNLRVEAHLLSIETNSDHPWAHRGERCADIRRITPGMGYSF